MVEFVRMGVIGGVPRLRVVQPGAPILSPSFAQTVFDSAFSAVRLRQSGALTFTTKGQSRSVSWADEGTIPFILMGLTSNGSIGWYGANITGGGYYYDARLWWIGGENKPVELAKAVMPYMFYDETSGNGGYDKAGFDANVTATGMTVTNHFKIWAAGNVYTVNYYVFSVATPGAS